MMSSNNFPNSGDAGSPKKDCVPSSKQSERNLSTHLKDFSLTHSSICFVTIF